MIDSIAPLDIRDISIIDALPVFNVEKTILTVGCGRGRVEAHLASMGHTVTGTDLLKYNEWDRITHVTFYQADIFDTNAFKSKAACVICSQVLEHLKDYRTAVRNLLELCEVRLILTFPHRKSFNARDHVNHWDDQASSRFRDVREFMQICRPFAVSIGKIRTKPQDLERNQSDYLLIVDKRQKFNNGI